MADYWYENSHELMVGDVFSHEYDENHFVKLDRRVPGDGTDWYVLDWVQKVSGGYWEDIDSRIHPCDLKERATYVHGWYESTSPASEETPSVEERTETSAW